MKKRTPPVPLQKLNGVPSADILIGFKDVHCRITKEEFVRCKVKLFSHGISMSRLMSFLIKEIAEENPLALKLVEELIKDEINRRMSKLKDNVKTREKSWYDDLDSTTMYSMIEDALGKKPKESEDDDDEHS